MYESDLVTIDEAKRILGVTNSEMSILLSRGELALYGSPEFRGKPLRDDVERLRLQRDSKGSTSR